MRPTNLFEAASSTIRGINAAFLYGDVQIKRGSPACDQLLLGKVNFKEISLHNKLLGTQKGPRIRRKERRKHFPQHKALLFSCGVLKYTPFSRMLGSLIGSLLESTPFSSGWRWRGFAGIGWEL